MLEEVVLLRSNDRAGSADAHPANGFSRGHLPFLHDVAANERAGTAQTSFTVNRQAATVRAQVQKI